MAEVYYFGYYRRQGVVYCVRWMEDYPETEGLIEKSKVRITEAEFEGPLNDLEVKYPCKE